MDALVFWGCFSPVGVRPFVPQMAFPPVFFEVSPFLYDTSLSVLQKLYKLYTKR